MAYGVKIAKGNAYKAAAIKRRHIRVRKKVSGTEVRPRLVVTRSNRHMVAQVIDDIKKFAEKAADLGENLRRPDRRRERNRHRVPHRL